MFQGWIDESLIRLLRAVNGGSRPCRHAIFENCILAGPSNHNFAIRHARSSRIDANTTIPVTSIPTIGASAGAFCVLAAFCRLDPEARITFLLMFFIPVNVKAKVLFWIDVAIAVLGILAPAGNVAHAAHLGGIVTAVVWVRYYVFGAGWSSIPILGRLSLPTIVIKRKSNSRRANTTRANSGRGRVIVVRTNEPDNSNDSDFISKKIDPILDKIREKGIHSLTDKERKILEKGKDRLSGK